MTFEHFFRLLPFHDTFLYTSYAFDYCIHLNVSLNFFLRFNLHAGTKKYQPRYSFSMFKVLKLIRKKFHNVWILEFFCEIFFNLTRIVSCAVFLNPFASQRPLVDQFPYLDDKRGLNSNESKNWLNADITFVSQ